MSTNQKAQPWMGNVIWPDQPEGTVDVTLQRSSPLAAHLKARLAVLHPAYFALPMATGIVAIACHVFHLAELAAALTWLNLIIYPTLLLLFGARSMLFRERFLADWTDHSRAPGFFTIVAATAVIGTQVTLTYGPILAAKVFWWASVALWATCTYTIFTLLTIRKNKPTLAQGINGGWLVAVVAMQSVCVLGCILNGDLFGNRDAALFTLMAFWLGGGMLYLWIIGLIFYRYMFFEFSPRDLMPPYWINMGAVAISTLAGSLLATASTSSPLLAPLRPFILGLSIMFWATATWWIPMLLILGFWRHRVQKIRLTYDPMYWGLVFPIGMYSVSTYRLAEALDAPFLVSLAKVFVVAATVAWTLTILGLARRILYAVMLGLQQLRLIQLRESSVLRAPSPYYEEDPMNVDQELYTQDLTATAPTHTHTHTHTHTDTKTEEVQLRTTPRAKAKRYAKAEERMKQGKNIVIGGCAVALIGVVGYCIACLSAEMNPGIGATFLENPTRLVAPTLGLIGVGTLLWLVGAFFYLNGVMESDPDGPDLHF